MKRVFVCAHESERVTAGMRDDEKAECVERRWTCVRNQSGCWPIGFVILEYKCKQRSFIVRAATYNLSGTRASGKRL